MPPPTLRHVGHVEPEHDSGCLDHVAVHTQTGHVSIAHTAKKTVDVLDPASGRHPFSARSTPNALWSTITRFGRIFGSLRNKNRQRRGRLELDEFNDHLLSDIGLSREPGERAVEREVRILMLRLPRC